MFRIKNSFDFCPFCKTKLRGDDRSKECNFKDCNLNGTTMRFGFDLRKPLKLSYKDIDLNYFELFWIIIQIKNEYIDFLVFNKKIKISRYDPNMKNEPIIELDLSNSNIQIDMNDLIVCITNLIDKFIRLKEFL
jgi:hypothetical protein